MRVLNDIEYLGVSELNEYQLSFLYQSACIWLGYDIGTYADFIEEKRSYYDNFSYITNKATEFYKFLLDSPIRKINPKVLVMLNNLIILENGNT